MNVGGHARIAKSTDQNRVEIPRQTSEAVRRDRNFVGEIPVGSPVEVSQRQIGASSLDDAHRLRNDFLPNAIAGNNGNPLRRAHAGNVSTAVKCLCRDGACPVSLAAETRQAASLQENGSA